MTAVHLSISQLAVETGQTRETVSRRLSASGVKATEKRKGYPVYRLRDALRVVLTAPDQDPEKLDPHRRKAHFQAEQAGIRLAAERGELVKRTDVAETFTAAFKSVQLVLETLPDILERDAGLAPEQVTCVERALDELRERLYAEVVKAGQDVRQSK